MDGVLSRAFLNRSRTRAAATPTNISTNSEPFAEKKGTPASPATALASSVFPVPGGPSNKMPLGSAAPISEYRGSPSIMSMISWNICTAWSTPATSLNLIPVPFLVSICSARVEPNASASLRRLDFFGCPPRLKNAINSIPAWKVQKPTMGIIG
eukprot:253863-Pyramimonas_sp.AAC.1